MGPLLKDMPLVASFVDSRSEGSGTSFSGEDCPSPSESERGGQKGVRVDRRGKRRVKNRDAARKSRKKQTERADILHQELQTLESSNSALEKEIAGLRREFRSYTAALEQHEPLCTHRPSSIPANAPCCPILSPSTSSIAPVTGGQRPCLPAPTTLPLSTLVTVPSTAHVTNPYPLLSTLYSPISNIAPLIAPNNLCASLTTPNTNISPPTTPITNISPPTTPRTNLVPPTIPAPSLSSISYPLTLYSLNLSTPAIEPPIELSLSDILDSPDWLCDPASPTWGEF